MKINQQRIQLAWQSAFEMRACPSENMLFSNDKKPELKAHITFCKICQGKLRTTQEDKQIWAKLAEKLTMKFTPQSIDSTPEAGQVWSLSNKLNGWGPSNLYYKAPKVLLLDQIEGSENGFKVVQLFSSPELMGPNDVWLSERFGFMEKWNTYSIHKKDLECCWGVATDNTLVKARAELQKLESGMGSKNRIQEYAPEGSILYQFQNLESEVGSYFAMQSMPALVYEYENAAAWDKITAALRKIVARVKGDIGKFESIIGENIRGWTLPPLPLLPAAPKNDIDEAFSLTNHLLSILGQARPADGYRYAFAAKTAGELLFPANLLKVTATEFELFQATVKLETPSWDERGLVIIGNIQDVTPMNLKAWWSLNEMESIPATTIELYEDNQFKIVFKGLDKLQKKNYKSRLKLLLIDEKE